MNEPQIDPERLAALLDGRLGPAERRALLHQLARADEDTLAAYADATALTREIGGVGRRWTRVAWIGAAAAAVAAIVVIGTSNGTMQSARGVDDPTRFADLLGPGSPASPLEHGWATRGGGTESRVRTQARAVRIGATITDLALASRAGDTTARALVSTMIRTLGETGGGGSAIAQYRQIGDSLNAGSPPSADQLRDAARSAAIVAGPEATNAGAWIEAARVAAVRHDTAFFAATASRDANRALDDNLELTPEAREALAKVHSLESTEPRDWPALAVALRELLAELAAPN